MKQFTRIALNLAIVVMVFGAWFGMLFGKSGALATRGLGSLKYYTVLSNLFEALVCLAWLIALAMKKQESKLIARLRLCSTAAVYLTFTVVIVFLGPLYGYLMMYQRANFWLHLIVPLLAIIEFVVFNRHEFTRREKYFASLSVLLYGTYYLSNVLLHEINFTYDFYGFVQWGVPVGIVIFAITAAMIYGEGLFLCFLNRRVRCKRPADADRSLKTAQQ